MGRHRALRWLGAAALCGSFAISAMAQTPPPPAPTVPAARIELGDSAVQDRAIEKRLRGIYAQIDGLEGVGVTARAGVVELSGEVPGARAREQALRLAQQVDSVVEVADNTQVARALTRRTAVSHRTRCCATCCATWCGW